MNGRKEETDSSRSQMREKDNIKQSSSDETIPQEPWEVTTDRLDGEPGGSPLDENGTQFFSLLSG